MAQGIVSPYVTGVLLKDASADSSSASAGSSSATETMDGWQRVWLLSAALAGAGAVEFQLVSTGEVIEGQWLESTHAQTRERGNAPSMAGQVTEMQ